LTCVSALVRRARRARACPAATTSTPKFDLLNIPLNPSDHFSGMEEPKFDIERVSPIWLITALCVVPFGLYQLLNLLSPLMDRFTAMKISAVCGIAIRRGRNRADDSVARSTSTPSNRCERSRSQKPLRLLMVSSTTVNTSYHSINKNLLR
jgi:hypothetical protein